MQLKVNLDGRVRENPMLRTKGVAHLGQGVSAVDTEICARDVLRSIAKQEGHRAHQVLGGSHFANGDERSPFIAELWVFVEDLAGAEGKKPRY